MCFWAMFKNLLGVSIDVAEDSNFEMVYLERNGGPEMSEADLVKIKSFYSGREFWERELGSDESTGLNLNGPSPGKLGIGKNRRKNGSGASDEELGLFDQNVSDFDKECKFE